MPRFPDTVCAGGCDRLIWSGTGSLPAGQAMCRECRAARAPERRKTNWRRKSAIRRGAAAVGPKLSIEQLGDRDGWRCHLCSREVDRSLPSHDRLAATFDHLMPVSHGGSDAPENLRLAHRGCNSSRGTRGNVQLLLVG